jgi:translocation and assembly module TamB
MGKITLKKIVLAAAVAAIVVSTFAFFRGPHISNLLKQLILPELSAATGKEVMAEKIYLNIFPLFIEAKELRVFDKGAEVLQIPRLKGYVELSGLVRKELVLRRVVVRGPRVAARSEQIEEIVENVKKYLALERKTAIKVVVRAIALDNGAFALGHKDMTVQGKGLDVEAVLNPKQLLARKRPGPRISVAMKEVAASVKGWPELKGQIKGAIAVKDDAIEVKSLQVGFLGSKIDASGLFPAKEDARAKKPKGPYGDLQVGLSLLVDSFKKIFSLKQRGEGEVTAKGTIHLLPDNLLRSTVDLKLKGDLYIETLMELLKVKERVEGRVDFTGGVKGPLNAITGSAAAHLRKGNLFDVDVDDLQCKVAYREGKLFFTEGKGELYNGRADAEAALSLSGEGYYSLKIAFSDVDSPAVFKLIGWDPGIPRGKVKGDLSTEGTTFNPSGRYVYESNTRGADVLGRVRKVMGSYAMRDDVITLSDSVANTDKSAVRFGGTVDLKASGLDLTLQARTSDLTDATLPYLSELRGSGDFSGALTGKFDNPVIAGKMVLQSASYEGFVLGEVTGNLNYRKDLLEVRELLALAVSETAKGTQPDRSTLAMKGTVRFPEGKELFDLKKPLYGLSVSMKNADLERALKVIYGKPLRPELKGRFDTEFSITGAGPKPLFKGAARMTSGTIEGIPPEAASLSYAYDYDTLVLEDVFLKKGESLLTGKGSISHDERFSFAASSARFFLKDLQLRGSPADAYLAFKAEGKGTLEDPRVDLEGTVHGGTFRDSSLGDGAIKVSMKNKAMTFDVSLLDGKAVMTGKADLKGEIPWTARLDMKPGRYDVVVGAFLKEIPEDLLVSMKGYAEMSGDRNHFSASAVINQMNVALYGNNFSNDSDIRFDVKDRRVTFASVKMRSGTTAFKVTGDMMIGSGYNLVMEGSSSLAPLKGFSKRIDVIRGDASLVFSLTGKWESPKLNGGVTVSNAFFGLKDMPYRISGLSGYLYIDEDRIVIQKLSGKLGGGDVDISGIAHLQGFVMKRFYVSAAMNSISVNISKEFTVNCSGTLLYSGTPDSQRLGGEIKINRALYREPVQWQLWPLKAKVKERPRGEIGAFEKTQLNVTVRGSDNILINNNIARASLSADAMVRGTPSNPLIIGRVETKSGIVYFRNNEFRILSATADFADPKRINPTMNIVAETLIEGYTVRLVLEGQIEHFNLTLSSTPSLEQMEILSLLTVGTLSKSPQGIQSGIGGSAATSFLSGQVQDIAQERVRTITGIDRVGVESSVSRVTGQSEQRLTVSKRLLGDRLSVTYSTALGSVAGDVIKLEYNVGNNVSLIGIRDELGALGGSIKFRFGFK